MYRLLIMLSVILFRLESAFVVPEDAISDSHCEFKRTGCLSAPDGATYYTDQLIKSKGLIFAGHDSPPVCTLVAAIPKITELFSIAAWPPELIYCQCNLGACAANAMAFCIRYLSIRNSRTPSNFLANPERLDPSRLYMYYNARFLEGEAWKSNSTDRDSGASIAGTILAVDKYGCCPEVFVDNPARPTNIFEYKGWGYDTKKFTVQPSPESYRFAYDPSFCGLNTCKELMSGGEHKNPYHSVSRYVQYMDIFSKYAKRGWLTPGQKQELVKECCAILVRNIPILYGFALDSSYEQHCNGFIPMPNIATFSATSGHAVVIVGYGNYNKSDPSKNYFKFINSWGPSWGNRGYGYLPEEYVANPNVFSRGGYAINLPKVTTTVTISMAAERVCSAASYLPAPVVKV
jgi:hypothetical protein